MFVVMAAGDGGLCSRVGAAQGVVFNCAGSGGKTERRAIRGWGTAAQSS